MRLRSRRKRNTSIDRLWSKLTDGGKTIMSTRRNFLALFSPLIVCLIACGCMVGPNFKPPEAPTAKRWVGPATTQITTDAPGQAEWWKSFDDPVLDKLIETAYRQNLSLRVAGLRVLEARAVRGIAVGEFFPQLQQINGSYSHVGLSSNTPFATKSTFFDASSASFDVAWELDVWGKFRRGIESADAN